jgi:dihydroorotate dehydrogenase (fumarate)
MDLTTDYLGLKLKNPLMPGASPLVDDLDMVRRLEDAGASAIVMHSLFEEQLVGEQLSSYSATVTPEGNPEASTYLPDPDEYHLGPDDYLSQIARIKEAVNLPVIASLNGATAGGWLDYAKRMAEAGADALELNIYDLAVDDDETSDHIEQRIVEIVTEVTRAVDTPVAVKIAPYYTALRHLAAKIDTAGADGLVMFTRLYQPDIDVENLELIRVNPVGLGDLPLRLRWLGILHGQVNLSLGASGGITTATEAIKALMAGADVIQVVSALLLNGPEYIATLLRRMQTWLEENEYDSLADLRGSMSMHRCPDPAAYERANYMKTLLSWRL